jgi:hypothetical protein
LPGLSACTSGAPAARGGIDAEQRPLGRPADRDFLVAHGQTAARSPTSASTASPR